MQPEPTTDPTSGHRRRTVLRGAAVLGVLGMTGTLAACGGGGDDEEVTQPDTSTGGEPASGGSAAVAGALGPASEIPMGGGKIYKDPPVVVTQPSMGEYKAFSSICTHEKCPVAEVSTTINCFCHGSKYDISTGEPTNPPATKGLEKKTVTIKDGQITVA